MKKTAKTIERPELLELPSDVVEGVFFDPLGTNAVAGVPDGVVAVVGVGLLGTDGVAGESGADGAFAGAATPLHWLTGGVLRLQAPGRASAWVWLMAIPNDEPPPLRRVQRHWA